MELEENNRWSDLDKVLLRDSKFTEAKYPFVPGQDLKQILSMVKILVVGAGGLGCEILKNLALMGFQDIHIIDLDTIDLSNLNRQFLFRQEDIGKKKSEVAANFIMKRIKNVKVTPYSQKIQDLETKFFEQFPLIIAGLDNIEARRYLNTIVHQFVDFDEKGNPRPETQKNFDRWRNWVF